ncbi:hypothetical protein HaLaN_30524, partial [Haematococcus lacustris]
ARRPLPLPLRGQPHLEHHTLPLSQHWQPGEQRAVGRAGFARRRPALCRSTCEPYRVHLQGAASGRAKRLRPVHPVIENTIIMYVSIDKAAKVSRFRLRLENGGACCDGHMEGRYADEPPALPSRHLGRAMLLAGRPGRAGCGAGCPAASQRPAPYGRAAGGAGGGGHCGSVQGGVLDGASAQGP